MSADAVVRSARWSFGLAGIYGLAATLPLYFKADALGSDIWMLGFAGAAVATQLLYFLIASDPHKYHSAIVVGIASKLSFALPALIVDPGNGLSRWDYAWPWFGLADLALAGLFALHYVRLRRL